MSSTVTVPLWLALVVALLAVWALLDRLLMPSARWFIRSRANKVLDEVSQRLPIHIRPFQQVRRQAMIDRLVFDEKVQNAARAFADAHQMPRAVALAQAQRYAREIVPAFNAYMYFRVGYWIGKEHWGQGVATRALAAFLQFVTERPLRAHVAAHNVGSIRVLEKCGFSVEQKVEVASDGVVELVLVLR